jgi:hypothetical protein
MQYQQLLMNQQINQHTLQIDQQMNIFAAQSARQLQQQSSRRYTQTLQQLERQVEHLSQMRQSRPQQLLRAAPAASIQMSLRGDYEAVTARMTMSATFVIVTKPSWRPFAVESSPLVSPVRRQSGRRSAVSQLPR